MTSQSHRIGTGTAVFVTSDAHPNCVLIGERKSAKAHGRDRFALPGGHVEFW